MPPRRAIPLIALVRVALLLVPAAARAADAPTVVVGARPTVRLSPTELAIFRVCGAIGAATLAVLFAAIAITAWRDGVVQLGKYRPVVSIRRTTDPLPFYIAIAFLWGCAAACAFLVVGAATSGPTLRVWAE